MGRPSSIEPELVRGSGFLSVCCVPTWDVVSDIHDSRCMGSDGLVSFLSVLDATEILRTSPVMLERGVLNLCRPVLRSFDSRGAEVSPPESGEEFS